MKTAFKLISLMVLTPAVLAGSLDPPSAPTNASSAMYSIQSICDRLQTGAVGSQNVFTEPTSGPGATGCTLNDVMSFAPTLDNTNGATPAEVVTGKTFWALRNGTWGLKTGTYNSGSACVGTATLGNVLSGQTFSNSSSSGLTGTMPNNGAVTLTPTTTTQTIAAGYHNGSGTVAGDANLVTGNIKNGITLFGVSGKTEVVDTTETTSPATAANLLSGKKAFVNGVAVTGTVPAGANVTGAAGNLVMTIPNGLYSGSTTATANDANLITGNIKSGVTIFGVTGTVSSGGSAAVPRTGQTTNYATGDDGGLRKGVAWPSLRFTDNTNGTVTDNLTGLIWLTNANCFGVKGWTTALSSANSLASGTCGLTDGSTAGQWRLPNVKELQSLIDFSKFNPALSTGYPFGTSVQNGYYWSASSGAYDTTSAWVVNLSSGYLYAGGKTFSYYVWPVRGGQ
jgi:hypothetical protein